MKWFQINHLPWARCIGCTAFPHTPLALWISLSSYPWSSRVPSSWGRSCTARCLEWRHRDHGTGLGTEPVAVRSEALPSLAYSDTPRSHRYRCWNTLDPGNPLQEPEVEKRVKNMPE